MTVAIIVAAGVGKRFGADKPKQFLELAGKPVVVRALQPFEDCEAVNEIVLVLAENEIENFQKNVGAKYVFKKIKSIVAGGETRAASVRNGLNAVSHDAEIVAVHDGARPLVSAEEIARTIEKAQETGAAILVAPATDTIKEISANGTILQTIERSRLRRALTPQCFKNEILRRAFEQFSDFNETATDESSLVEKSGVAVSVVEGSPRNIKITVPQDLVLAEALLKTIENQKL
jgi:2-C-methyl-D-erythritol 4-phosphate cytidylyltransferase